MHRIDAFYGKAASLGDVEDGMQHALPLQVQSHSGLRAGLRRFPTQTDVAFYRAKQEHALPGWARKLVAEQRGPTPVLLIDLAVNAHAGIRFTSGQLAASNLLSILRRTNRDLDRPALAAKLWELARNPECMINPARRASFARKWARRLERSAS